MAIYIFNFLSIPIYSVAIKNRKRFIILASFQMFLILALRNVQLGVDLGNYSEGFQYISGLRFIEMLPKLHFWQTADLIYPFDYESGYVVLNWIVSHLGFEFHGFLVVCAAINMIAVGYFIYRYSKVPWLSFLMICSLGTYTYMFGIIRQSLAVSMVLFAIIFALDRKYWKFVIMLILAFTFHRTMIVILPLLFFLRKEQINKNNYTSVLVCWVGFIIVSAAVYKRLLIPIMMFFQRYYKGHAMQWNKLIILLVLIVLVTILFCNFSKNMSESINIISAWAVMLGLFLETVGMYNDVLARSVQYYTIFLVILVPHVLAEYKDKKIVFGAKGVMIFLLCGYMIYALSNYAILVPYRTIWSV